MLLIYLSNLGMGGSAKSLTQPRTITIGPIDLNLSADDVITVKVVKLSGTPTIKTIAKGSSLTVHGT